MSFNTMDAEKRHEICSAGGRAAHALGRAHEWTVEEAKQAGSKGGKALLEKRGPDYFRELGKKGGAAVSKDREHMADIGRKGGQKVAETPGWMSELAKKNRNK